MIVEDFFDRKLLDECREAVNELVEQLAQKLFKAGKIKGDWTDTINVWVEKQHYAFNIALGFVYYILYLI